jgi:hypothetical protein
MRPRAVAAPLMANRMVAAPKSAVETPLSELYEIHDATAAKTARGAGRPPARTCPCGCGCGRSAPAG